MDIKETQEALKQLNERNLGFQYHDDFNKNVLKNRRLPTEVYNHVMAMIQDKRTLNRIKQRLETEIKDLESQSASSSSSVQGSGLIRKKAKAKTKAKAKGKAIKHEFALGGPFAPTQPITIQCQTQGYNHNFINSK